MLKPLENDFRWSFSKLETYETCPWAFRLQYMEDPPIQQQQNAFAEYGTLCHELLEKYSKGELKKEQLTAEFKSKYDSYVVHSYPPFPRGYAEKAFQQAVDYFDAFDGFGDQYEFVEAEHKFVLDIGPYKLSGIADLVLKEKDTGEYIVIDHKTKSADSMKKDVDSYTRQLYLYAQYVYQQYGKYPKEMRFNMIKTQSWITIPFKKERLDEVLQWAEDTIDDIIMDNEYESRPNFYFCRFICGAFSYCQEGMDFCSKNTKGGK